MWLTVSILHRLSLLGRFGDNFDHPALEGTHFLAVAQKQSEQQAEVLPLVLIRDEKRLGTSKQLLQRQRRTVTENTRKTSFEIIPKTIKINWIIKQVCCAANYRLECVSLTFEFGCSSKASLKESACD